MSMPHIPFPDLDHPPAEARARNEAFFRKRGRRSFQTLMLTQYGPGLSIINTYGNVMEEGQRPSRLKELIFAASSAARGCFD
jgi:hypothetical protein